MTERFQTDHRELDELFERYRATPKGHVFAPLADACRKAGMLEEALEICARGVGEHPRYASGYVVQGKCLYDSGRSNDAQAAFNRVLDLDPKNLVALKYLGIIHAERGESALAHEFFEHILALDPGDREIRSRMEYVTPRNPAASTKVAPPATAAPDSARDSDDLLAEEDPLLLPDVEEEFEAQPITLGDESKMSEEIATMTLADIYASQGYTTRALRIYREVLKRQPGNTDLAAKIQKLEREEAAEVLAQPVAMAIESPVEAVPAAAERPARTQDAPVAPKPAAPSSAPVGQAIDQGRNYEQFKRWLKASSR